MDELEAKIRIFEAIANNSERLSDSEEYITPYGVAKYANRIYGMLTEKESKL